GARRPRRLRGAGGGGVAPHHRPLRWGHSRGVLPGAGRPGRPAAVGGDHRALRRRALGADRRPGVERAPRPHGPGRRGRTGGRALDEGSRCRAGRRCRRLRRHRRRGCAHRRDPPRPGRGRPHRLAVPGVGGARRAAGPRRRHRRRPPPPPPPDPHLPGHRHRPPRRRHRRRSRQGAGMGPPLCRGRRAGGPHQRRAGGVARRPRGRRRHPRAGL
ncbi:MAG: 6-phosphogluconolactonase, eukaryotic type, partial [uncultured Acidimicrobiales bacterium]